MSEKPVTIVGQRGSKVVFAIEEQPNLESLFEKCKPDHEKYLLDRKRELGQECEDWRNRASAKTFKSFDRLQDALKEYEFVENLFEKAREKLERRQKIFSASTWLDWDSRR